MSDSMACTRISSRFRFLRESAEAENSRGFWADCDWWYGRGLEFRWGSIQITAASSLGYAPGGQAARIRRWHLAQTAAAFIAAALDVPRDHRRKAQ